MAKDNYYQILGVDTSASVEQIKQSYRALARKYHPDSGEPDSSDLLFKKINEAYATLSNAEKRKRYDERHGFSKKGAQKLEAYRKAAKVFGDVPPTPDEPLTDHDALKNFRSTSGSFSGPASQRFNQSPEEEDGVSGAMKQFFGKVSSTLKRDSGSHERDSLWAKVTRGFGRDELEEPDPANEMQTKRVDFTIDALESLTGTAREVALESQFGPRMLRVKVPAGIADGALLKVNAPPRLGEQGVVLHVRVKVVPHRYVEREGTDIVLKIPVSLAEALYGTEFEIPTLDGSIKTRIPPNWDVENRLRFRGKGIPANGSTGDLYVKLFIVSPDASSPDLREAVQLLQHHYRRNIREEVPKSLLGGNGGNGGNGESGS